MRRAWLELVYYTFERCDVAVAGNAGAAGGIRLAATSADERVADFVEQVLQKSCQGYVRP